MDFAHDKSIWSQLEDIASCPLDCNIKQIAALLNDRSTTADEVCVAQCKASRVAFSRFINGSGLRCLAMASRDGSLVTETLGLVGRVFIQWTSNAYTVSLYHSPKHRANRTTKAKLEPLTEKECDDIYAELAQQTA